MFANLSLEYKVPLRVSILILLVGTVVALSLLLGAYRVFKEDLVISSENLGRIMSRSLTPAMLHDDTWKAYEIINTPFAIESSQKALQAELITVLDANNRVYISTRPSEFPILTDAKTNDTTLNTVVSSLDEKIKREQFSFQNEAFGNYYVITPIDSDGVLLGTLVMRYSSEIFLDRFFAIARLAFITLIALILLMTPLGAYWGRRTAKPLVQLAECMEQVGAEIPEEIACEIKRGGDEIGQLGEQFLRMVDELREKEVLEQQVMAAQRLAAIGRFTAGIAHEINNPLGGMLNAISTLRKHGHCDAMTLKTLQLLERGLLQIKDTVGALLVEASPDHHPLSRQDIEDTKMLVQQEASKRFIQIALHNKIYEVLPISSTLVRQAVINLLLNAIHATPDRGLVDCNIGVTEKYLTIEVANQGKRISDEKLNRLFEPFSSDKESGRGLGLWVTYQIVENLHGDIEVSTSEEITKFSIRLPILLEEAA